MRHKIVRLDLIVQEDEFGFCLIARDRNSGRIHTHLQFPLTAGAELERQFYDRVGDIVKRDFRPFIFEVKKSRGAK